ncbi:MAG: hypothetical protein WCO06_02945 [Candidatus Roizmanbacteria bacterium]
MYICSECKKEMEEIVYDGQKFLHCYSCGADFFPEKTINHVSLKTAQELALAHENVSHDDSLRLCPHDQTALILIENAESVPPEVQLFRCSMCKGVSISAQNFLIYKQSLTKKIEYFKAWNIPFLPQAVALFGIVLMVSISFTTGFPNFNSTSIPSQAQDQITNVSIRQQNEQLVVYFNTSNPMKSSLALFDANKNQIASYILRSEPSTSHILLKKIEKNQEYVYFQIIVSDKGKTISTEIKKIE